MRAMMLALGACAAPSGSDAVPGGGGETGAATTARETGWSFATLDDADGGLQLQLVAGEASAWAAWFATAPTSDGICDEIEVAPPPRERFALRAARVTIAGVEPALDVAAPVAAVQPAGLDLAIDESGRPALAFTGGEPEGQYCGAHDAVLASFDGEGWVSQTAAVDSGDAASGEPASDAGFVVGHWPAVAFDPQGEPAVLYRDVHFGSLQRDDQFRADAELAWKTGGTWQREIVDLGDGGGAHGRLAFDPEGRPVAAYVIPVEKAKSRLGVWVARLDGGVWEHVRLHDGDVPDQIGLVVDEGGITVAFTDTRVRSARLRQLSAGADLSDPGAWSDERVGRGPYDEGRHVSVAIDPDGAPVLAYHVCKRLTDTQTSCNLGDEALVVAAREGDGWSYEVVRSAAGGSCGRYTSLAFDRTGRAWLGFRCSVEVADGFAFRPQIAWRDW